MKRSRGNHFCVAISAFAIIANSQLFAQHTDLALTEAGRRIMIAAPQPEYPAEARAKHITGSGVYDVWMRVKPGVVTRVDIIRSTGSKLLDDAAVKSLRHWRARPNTVSHMRVPIRFLL
jgi:TonB family protein